jgi:hypothetical protein
MDRELVKIRDNIAQRLSTKHNIEISCFDLEYYAWPCAFGSTAGPTGGIGGQQITNFTVHGFLLPLFGDGYLFCCGKYKYKQKFIPLMGWE